jgi:hypothetical protein
MLAGNILLISGGLTGSSISDHYQNAQNQSNDNSFYLLNFGMSDLFDVKTRFN